MADWIQMPFGVVRGVGRGMGVLDGGGDRRRGKGSFGGEFGASHCNQWGLCDALFSNYFEDLFFYVYYTLAAGQGHLSVLRFLLSNGADSSSVDSAGDTARDVAVRFRQLAAVRLLSHDTGQTPTFTAVDY